IDLGIDIRPLELRCAGIAQNTEQPRVPRIEAVRRAQPDFPSRGGELLVGLPVIPDHQLRELPHPRAERAGQGELARSILEAVGSGGTANEVLRGDDRSAVLGALGYCRRREHGDHDDGEHNPEHKGLLVVRLRLGRETCRRGLRSCAALKSDAASARSRLQSTRERKVRAPFIDWVTRWRAIVARQWSELWTAVVKPAGPRESEAIATSARQNA